MIATLAGCAGGTRQEVRVHITLYEDYTGDAPCHGDGPVAWAHAGNTIKIREGTADDAMPIDRATLTAGTLGPNGCTLAFTFTAPVGFDEYTMFLCDHPDESCDSVGYTWDELESGGFDLNWCYKCEGSPLRPGDDAGSSDGGISTG